MLAASWMIGHGVSSRSSHSWAAGRTTVSAKSCTHFSIWSWSSLRSRENSGIATPPPRSVQEPEPTKLPNGNIARGVGKETRPPVRSAAMRALAYGADDSFAVVDRPDPEPGPGEVVVAVERCGICGSDLHLRQSHMLPPGSVMGHEFGGTVVARGDHVDGLAEGTRVAVLPAVRCGTCRTCVEGRDAICLEQSRFMLGIGTEDGAYAEYVRIAAKSCFPMPHDMTPEQGALFEPYAVGLHAV